MPASTSEDNGGELHMRLSIARLGSVLVGTLVPTIPTIPEVER